MLEAALAAHKYSKGANSKALVAVALHHHGKIKESLKWYEEAWRCPHEEGFEIDIGYSNALLFQPDRWHKAWPIVKALKKRMVYALYLPFWDRKPVEKLSIVSEGGFGDLIQNCRWLPHAQELAKDLTVYLPPYFFEHGFVDLCRLQPWFPKIKSLLELPQGVPAAGFFDLPALWDATPNDIPDYPQPWVCDPVLDSEFAYQVIDPSVEGPEVGFCHAARAMETPLCPDGVYRALTKEQANSIRKTDGINWVSLQKDENPDLKSWQDTAAVIANLDAIVTVDTAVMHLAAAMGKPTFVILSGATDWKFGLTEIGDAAIQKWYPNIKLFRNRGFGMQDAVNQVLEFLKRGGLHEEVYKTKPQPVTGQHSCSESSSS